MDIQTDQPFRLRSSSVNPSAHGEQILETGDKHPPGHGVVSPINSKEKEEIRRPKDAAGPSFYTPQA